MIHKLKTINPICCGILELMEIGWMQLEDGTKCLPHINGKDLIKYKVNNCPSCGKDLTDII